LFDRWAVQPSWTVLDTGFASGNTFLELWRCWRAHATRPRMLHWVGLLSLPEAAALAEHLTQTASPDTPNAELAATLAGHCYGLGVGFHRILLDDGCLSLTLCVGEVVHSLAQLDLRADTLWAQAQVPEAGWDKWALKALARCCKRGSHVVFSGPPLPPVTLLLEAGFRTDVETVAQTDTATLTGQHVLQARYDPHWRLGSERRAEHDSARSPGRCAVVGAGIAGASVARALALRGWQVDVYDSQPAPAGGAAGLPVGLVVPHHSADDSARSRLSRAGTRLMLQHAQELLAVGQDWQPGGVLELKIEATGLDQAEAEVLSHSTPQREPTGWSSRRELGQAQGLWHPYAAWIKPERLVQQWLAHASIHFHGATPIHNLQRVAQQWRLHNAQGAEVGRADVVVFANAFGCVELIQRLAANLPSEPVPGSDVAWLPDALHKLQSLQAMYGTLSLGPCPAPGAGGAQALPAFPVNGHGSFVSGVPTAQGLRWYAGSTFQTERALHADLAREHATNQSKLQALLPQVAALLAPQFASHQVQAWQGTRCISHDRLPLVGPLDDAAQPTLWLCAAMGARGLSFSALCAELLAAWLGHEPLPIESHLAKALGTRRAVRKKAP
jgi:tRNA 5-methylaminomethyl-2-thiouridine biosynthesis bifunctional protein